MKHLLLQVLVCLFLASCQKPAPSTETPSTQVAQELYRPQYHFTPKAGWMNDPNGMVYYDGEYHLFYQHYPDSTVWGPMHWGHAVSKDLIQWEHLPIALYPDKLGYIFSGSAVMDLENTSGLGTAEAPPMVAIFTSHDMEGERAGKKDYETQSIAYSVDKGRTWTKYEKNPVLPNPGIRDFRDPKVAWNNVAKQWVMTLAVTDHIEFYGSPDLKKWTKLSEFGKKLGSHRGVWECPDLFSLTDADGKTKWILFVSINPGGPQGGSATQYFVGEFNGKSFSSQDTVTRWIDYGPDNYAGVTWSNIPQSDGRRLFLGWMSNWQYANVVPTEAWRSANTVPREVSLNKKVTGYELKFKPARELAKIMGAPVAFTDSARLESSQYVLEFTIDEGQSDFALTISNDADEKIVLKGDASTLLFDRTASGKSSFSPVFAAIHQADIRGVAVKKVTVFADAASMEIFINDGERVMTEIVFPIKVYSNVRLEKANAQFTVAGISSVAGK
jgi:fructan beta-fructosidase